MISVRIGSILTLGLAGLTGLLLHPSMETAHLGSRRSVISVIPGSIVTHYSLSGHKGLLIQPSMEAFLLVNAFSDIS